MGRSPQTRRALRASHSLPQPRVLAGSHRDAGIGHRGERGHLLRCAGRASQAAAVPQSRSNRGAGAFLQEHRHDRNVVSAPDFHDWRRQNRVFERMAYHNGGEVTVVVHGVPAFVHAQAVTPEFFAVFGLPPEAGRFWSEPEDRTPLAVISELWARQQFGDVGAAIGKTITVRGTSIEVIGVARAGFRYPRSTDIWIPAGLRPENQHRSGHNYFAIGRLRPAVALTAARTEMRAIGDRLEREYPENRFKTVAVTPLAEKVTKSAQTTLWVLLGAVFGVLLIACANVANLQLARAASRTREMAVRAALGAARGRILRQVLTESAVLCAAGTAIGLGLSAMLLRGLVAIAPADIPRLDEVRMDVPVLLFVLALAVLCGLLFGLAPARGSSGANSISGLRQGGTKGSLGGVTGRTRAVLVVSEVALSMMLLAGAGLLLRSFLALLRVDLGFSTDRLLLTHTSVPVSGENEARRATEFQRDLIERIALLPGARRAAGVKTLPFAARRSTAQYQIKGGRKYRPGDAPSAQMQIVTPRYFETLGVPVLHGRDFANSDSWGRPQVAIINETLAREAFGDENPLGRTISCGMSLQSIKGMEIVGVVRGARQINPGEPPKPELFLPYLQHPGPGSNLTLIVETRLEPQALSTAIRQTAGRLNPRTPVRFSTMDEVVYESLAYPRFRAALIGWLGLLAACLAIVGVYGVVSYLVGQRTSEIGVRFALGARPADVFRLVISGSMRLVLCGLALG
ncbi:MAG: ABC transporter permease, partial [Bryobacteraceae bacterium]